MSPVRRRARRTAALAIGLAAAAAVLLVARRDDARSADPPSAASALDATGPNDGATPSVPAPAAQQASAQPTRSAAPDVEPEWLRHPFELALEVHVCDASGRPVAGHVPVIAPVGGMPCSTDVASDEDGIAVLRLPAREPEACIELADPRGHFHAVRLRHDRPTRVALVLPTADDAHATAAPMPAFGSRDALHAHARFEVDAQTASRGEPFETHARSRAPQPGQRTRPTSRGELTIRGAVHDVHGVPCVDVEVEWRDDDGTFGAAAHTDGDGMFELLDLPDGTGLVVVHGLPGMAMPLASRAGVRAGDHDVRLSVSRSEGSVLQVQAAQSGAAAGWLSVHDEATGFVAVVAGDGASTRAAWQVAHLRAGHYCVAVRGPGPGHVALGRHWLDGRTTVDLGTAPCAPPCAVDIAPVAEGHAGVLRLELVALRPDFDVRLVRRPEPGERLLLPPGDYALFGAAVDPSRNLEPVRFTTRAGASIRVPLPR